MPASTSSSRAEVGPTTSLEHKMALRCVTVIMGTVIGLTFLFGFGNVLALGLRLGVPAYVAPLVAPAVDLSVLGLLLGVRYLALNGASRDEIRPARRLLVLASVMTLALNVTEPLLAGEYGKAAFDAVGPLLLIGWAEVGPGLLQAISKTGKAGGAPTEPVVDQRVSTPTPPTKRPRPPTDRKKRIRPGHSAGIDPQLLELARVEDARHWEAHQRHISAENLRRRLRVGAKKSRALVAAVRSEGQSRGDPGQADANSDEQREYGRSNEVDDRVPVG